VKNETLKKKIVKKIEKRKSKIQSSMF